VTAAKANAANLAADAGDAICSSYDDIVPPSKAPKVDGGIDVETQQQGDTVIETSFSLLTNLPFVLFCSEDREGVNDVARTKENSDDGLDVDEDNFHVPWVLSHGFEPSSLIGCRGSSPGWKGDE
jgi:hypothetical protein